MRTPSLALHDRDPLTPHHPACLTAPSLSVKGVGGEVLSLTIPPRSWYFSSIGAMPPRIASTLPTPYTRQTPNPRPLTTSHIHVMPWAPSYPTQRCHFCRRPC